VRCFHRIVGGTCTHSTPPHSCRIRYHPRSESVPEGASSVVVGLEWCRYGEVSPRLDADCNIVRRYGSRHVEAMRVQVSIGSREDRCNFRPCMGMCICDHAADGGRSGSGIPELINVTRSTSESLQEGRLELGTERRHCTSACDIIDRRPAALRQR